MKKLIIDLDEWKSVNNENFGLRIEIEKLKNENELLKEQLKVLRESINNLYNESVSLDIIDENEMSHMEEI